MTGAAKLIPCWLVKAYRDAVEVAFGANVDFAQLIKDYGKDPNAARR
ncbi:MAG TPA: hypothetical protein VEZ14_10255 [Dehalococcoidia bacterium]|nr:hypothetical protein [Dehalococcoidia bacterium]